MTLSLSTLLLRTPHQFLSTYNQDKEHKLNFGTRERIVIAVMNEAEVPLVQTSASP